MKEITLALLAMMVLSGCAREPTTTADLSRHGPNSVVIDGYSPVSYFESSKAEKGSPEFAVSYEGLGYWLTDASQAEAFAANPERYAPAHRTYE